MKKYKDWADLFVEKLFSKDQTMCDISEIIDHSTDRLAETILYKVKKVNNEIEYIADKENEFHDDSFVLKVIKGFSNKFEENVEFKVEIEYYLNKDNHFSYKSKRL